MSSSGKTGMHQGHNRSADSSGCYSMQRQRAPKSPDGRNTPFSMVSKVCSAAITPFSGLIGPMIERTQAPPSSAAAVLCSTSQGQGSGSLS